MFSSPPRSILMALVVGGVTHDPIKARRRLEQARAASTIAVTRHRCIHCHHHLCLRRRCHCRSSLSSPLQNAAVVFSASAIAAAAVAAAAAAAITIAVAAATTIAATAAVVDCYVFVTPTS